MEFAGTRGWETTAQVLEAAEEVITISMGSEGLHKNFSCLDSKKKNNNIK